MSATEACRACDRRFSTFQELQTHFNEDTHNDLTFHCDVVCGRSFGSRAELLHHKVTAPLHNRLDLYVGQDEWGCGSILLCEECDATFESIDSLYHHLRDEYGHNIPDEELLPYGSGERPSLEWVRHVVENGPNQTNPENIYRPAPHDLNLHHLASPHASSTPSTSSPTPASFFSLVARARSTLTSSTENTNGASLNKQTLSDENDVTTTLLGVDCPAESKKPVEFGPQTLAEMLESMTAKMAALESELKTTKEELDNQKALHTCSMCYENEVDAVTGCGHQFCSGCLGDWFATQNNVEQTPCPMCRGAIDTLVKLYT